MSALLDNYFCEVVETSRGVIIKIKCRCDAEVILMNAGNSSGVGLHVRTLGVGALMLSAEGNAISHIPSSEIDREYLVKLEK